MLKKILLHFLIFGRNFFKTIPFSRVSDPDTDPAFFLIADPDSGSGSRILIPDPDPGFDDLKLKKIYSWKFS